MPHNSQCEFEAVLSLADNAYYPWGLLRLLEGLFLEALRSRLIGLLAEPTPGLEEIDTFFSDLSPEACAELTKTITGRHQRKLWEAAAGRPVRLDDIVPSDISSAYEVIHLGRNSLPVFHQFQKRFCRIEGSEDILYGYNEGKLRPLIGPGYFVARHDEETNSFCVDYHDIPPDDAHLPKGWPTLKTNDQGLGKLVFGGMIDYLRKVSPRVLIGRASRGGKLQNAYFILCRSDSNEH